MLSFNPAVGAGLHRHHRACRCRRPTSSCSTTTASEVGIGAARRDLRQGPAGDERLLAAARGQRRGVHRRRLLPHRRRRRVRRQGLPEDRRSQEGHDHRLGLQRLSRTRSRRWPPPAPASPSAPASACPTRRPARRSSCSSSRRRTSTLSEADVIAHCRKELTGLQGAARSCASSKRCRSRPSARSCAANCAPWPERIAPETSHATTLQGTRRRGRDRAHGAHLRDASGRPVSSTRRRTWRSARPSCAPSSIACAATRTTSSPPSTPTSAAARRPRPSWSRCWGRSSRSIMRCSQLRRWMKPRRRSTELLFLTQQRLRCSYQPKGVVGVIGRGTSRSTWRSGR